MDRFQFRQQGHLQLLDTSLNWLIPFVPCHLPGPATSVEIGVNELEIANALEPIRVVKAKTSDLLIPADSEWVIEGKVYRDRRHDEWPFIDLTQTYDVIRNEPLFEVTCITHRKDAIWQAFISQFPPSESSTIRQIACANVIPKRIKHDLGMSFVRQVGVHFTNGSDRFVVLQLDKCKPKDAWRALEAMPEQFPAFSKVVVAVDKDINPWSSNMVNWAITYRSQPHRDIRIKKVPVPDSQDYSIRPPEGDTLVTVPETVEILLMTAAGALVLSRNATEVSREERMGKTS